MRSILTWSFCLLSSSACGGLFPTQDRHNDNNLRPLFGSNRLIDALRAGGDSARRIAPLIKPKTCAEAREAIANLMLTQMRSEFDAQLKWFRPAQQDEGDLPSQADGASPESAMDNAGSAASKSGPENFTTTNNQVDGVEEGDFIKNTGTHMFLAQENKIHVVKSWPASEMHTLATLQLADKVNEMVFVGENTLVVSGRPELLPPQQTGGPAGPRTSFESEQDPGFFQQPRYAYNSVGLTVIDISNPSAPVIKNRFVLRGNYQSFRRIGTSVRMVLNQYFAYPKSVQAYVPWEETRRFASQSQYRDRLDALYTENQDKLQKMSLSELLSTSHDWYEQSEALKDREGYLEIATSNDTCSNFYIPQIPAESFGLSAIVTLDLSSERPTVQQDVILGNGGLVYASKNSLYLASSSWRWWSGWSADLDDGTILNHTILHRFDLSQPDRVGYQGSGIIEGDLKDQFSMDEFEDVLRVATTVRRKQGTQGEWDWNTTTTNRVTTLGLQEQSLEVLGQSPDLAEGESIFSARFAGPRGFIVTFRQVDPLYSFDLSNPAEPRVLGELKIPGFSEYMQFIDQNHILTVGRDADPTTGLSRGLKISLFDVSDMKQLKEVDHHILNTNGWQNSDASYDHKAFTYFPTTGHLAIPVMSYSDSYQNDLQIFRVSPESGVRPSGKVNLNEIHEEINKQNHWAPWYLRVRRSVFADDVLYAISQGGIKAVRTESPDQTLSTLEFPCDEGCSSGWWY